MVIIGSQYVSIVVGLDGDPRHASKFRGVPELALFEVKVRNGGKVVYNGQVLET